MRVTENGGDGIKTKPRPKKLMHSARTVRGKIERFLRRNLTANQLQSMYDSLTAKEKLHYITELLPYVLAKPAAGSDMDLDRLSDSQVDELYDRVMKAAV